jgi:hypothetical protein
VKNTAAPQTTSIAIPTNTENRAGLNFLVIPRVDIHTARVLTPRQSLSALVAIAIARWDMQTSFDLFVSSESFHEASPNNL